MIFTLTCGRCVLKVKFFLWAYLYYYLINF